MLGNMSIEKVDHDLFVDFINCYAIVFKVLRLVSKDVDYTKEQIQELGITNTPFGYSVCKVFATSQALTGFGAAMGKMRDLKVINSLEQVSKAVSDISEDIEDDWFEELLVKLDTIKNTALNCQVKCNTLCKKTSSGVFQPRHLRGRRLSNFATASTSSCVTSAKEVRLGKN